MQVQLEHSYKAAQVDSNTPSRLSKTSVQKLVQPKIGCLLYRACLPVLFSAGHFVSFRFTISVPGFIACPLGNC